MNVVTIPEPAATVPVSEVKERTQGLLLRMEPPTKMVGETGAVFRKHKFAGNRGKR